MPFIIATLQFFFRISARVSWQVSSMSFGLELVTYHIGTAVLDKVFLGGPSAKNVSSPRRNRPPRQRG